jgi:hypothetical protein
MGKQHDQHPFEHNPFLEDLAAWMDSPAGELSSEALDAVWTLLEKVDVDAKNRKIIWEDGQRLSICESVQRIHAGCPDFPLELIETHLLGWLEMEFVPPNASPEQLDELDRLTENWIEDHERRAEAARKRGRTRHS